ncbi:hypothetical protein K5X82_14920 [Halosquirtibacter xylanolyticus]|uniref:hypothetical protein n=1 Tax=Halosquirtibacter xylanolyticus TaxID=3374599 RepID=UPI00374984BC|nr:hypothetical protein K5X82_14920 [Prolixibacteraceae bacterium]
MNKMKTILLLLLCYCPLISFCQTTVNSKSSESLLTVKRKMVDCIKSSEIEEAQKYYQQLVQDNESNSIMMYSEWLYCSMIFNDPEQFHRMIFVSDYKKPKVVSEKAMQQYKSTYSTIKRYYKRNFRTIKKAIVHNSSITEKENILYVNFLTTTDPNKASSMYYQQIGMLKHQLKSDEYLNNQFFNTWLIQEMSSKNSVSSELELGEEMQSYNPGPWTIIGVGMNGYSPIEKDFIGGNGIYFSVGTMYKAFLIESNFSFTNCEIAEKMNLFGDDGSINIKGKGADMTFYDINIGFGPAISIGQSQIILLARFGYSSMQIKGSREKYKLTSNLNICPAAKLNLCIHNKVLRGAGDKPFKLYLSAEGGYKKSVVNLYRDIDDDGGYFQVGLNFAFK